MAVVHLLVEDEEDGLHGVVRQHRLDGLDVRPGGRLEVLLAEHIPAELVVVRDLEDLGVLDSAEEVVDEALDGVVHLVALLLALELQVNDHAGLGLTLALPVEVVAATAAAVARVLGKQSGKDYLACLWVLVGALEVFTS